MSKEKNSNLKDIIIGLTLFALIIIFWYLSWCYIDKNITSDSLKITNMESRGLFGDKFGAINSLFSGLAFAGIIFTIFLQKRELSLQREELEETRNELKGQKIELKKANEFASLQYFDNKFFQMIDLQNSIKKGINVIESTPTYFHMKNMSGISFFERLAYLISIGFYDNSTHAEKMFGKGQTLQKLTLLYHHAYHQYKAELSHYFRNLFQIVRIIDESELLSDEQKIEYVKILRAQLSQYELVLLAYNGIMKYGGSFYPLINKYELLQSIDFELLTPENYKSKIISPEILIEKYEHLRKAYNKQIKLIAEFQNIP